MRGWRFIFLILGSFVCGALQAETRQWNDLSEKSVKQGWKLLEEKKDYDTALMHFNHAILLNLESGPAWFASAYAYSLKGKLDDSLSYYRQSLKYQPDYASTHMNIGILLLGKGEMEDSLRSLLKARDLAPERGAVHGNLARWYYTNKRLPEAKQALSLARQYKSTIDADFLKLLSKYIDASPDN